jgi:hypothetical protein
MSTTTYEFTPHSAYRAWQEQVDPADVLAALAEDHRSVLNGTGARDHFVWIDDVEYRVVCAGRIIVTLHRDVKDPKLRDELKALSRRSKQMAGMNRRQRY